MHRDAQTVEALPGARGTVATMTDSPRQTSTAARGVALVVALLAAVGVWLTWRVFVGSAVGQAIEQAAYDGATYGQSTLWRIAEPILDVVSITFIVLGAGAAVAVALIRRRWALALMAAVLVGGANLTSQVLKEVVLERPDFGYAAWGNSLPSGHTTVAASFAAALLLVAPRRGRPWVALAGAAYTAATGVSTLIGQWHRPSDAFAAVLVVLAWTAFVSAVEPESAADPPGPDAEAATGVGVVLLVVAGLATGVPAVWGLASAYDAASSGVPPGDVATYVAGAFGVVSTTALAFAAMLLVRQSTARRVVG